MTGWTNEVGFYYDRYYLEPDDYDEETEEDDFDEVILEEDDIYEC